MCEMFARQPQRNYQTETRSLRIEGQSTSIRLELAFWDVLEEIALKEHTSLAKFLTKLHNEVIEQHGEVKNFTSLLRCCCLVHRSSSLSAAADFARSMPVLHGDPRQVDLPATGHVRVDEAALAISDR